MIVLRIGLLYLDRDEMKSDFSAKSVIVTKNHKAHEMPFIIQQVHRMMIFLSCI